MANHWLVRLLATLIYTVRLKKDSYMRLLDLPLALPVGQYADLGFGLRERPLGHLVSKREPLACDRNEGVGRGGFRDGRPFLPDTG